MFNVQSSAEYGRMLTASSLISPSSTILVESPAVHVVIDTLCKTHCSNCLKECLSPQQCSQCSKLVYCNSSCQRSDWKEHSKECKSFVTHLHHQPATIRAICRLIYKVSPEIILESSLQNRLKFSESRITEFAQMAALINRILGEKAPDFATIMALLCIWSTNSMSISAPDFSTVGVGLYIKSAWANHSCDANAHLVFNGITAHVVASKSIPEGTQIFVSYVDQTLSRAQRKLELERYFFECKCRLCVSAIDILGTNTTALDQLPTCVSVETLESLDDLLGALEVQTKHYTATHASLFRTRELLIPKLIDNQNWRLLIDTCQMQIEAYSIVFGHAHPVGSVLSYHVFKAALNLDDMEVARIYGERCVRLLRCTHGSENELYCEALQAYKMLCLELTSSG